MELIITFFNEKLNISVHFPISYQKIKKMEVDFFDYFLALLRKDY